MTGYYGRLRYLQGKQWINTKDAGQKEIGRICPFFFKKRERKMSQIKKNFFL